MKSIIKKLFLAVIFCGVIGAGVFAFTYGELSETEIAMAVGDTTELSVDNPILQAMASFESVDEEILRVDNEGFVTANAPGKTKVIMNTPIRSMTCKVSVLGFEESEITMLTGRSKEISTIGTSKEATFTSSDPSVVAVEEGKLIARMDGTAELICKDQGLTIKQRVRVAGITAEKPFLCAGNEMQMNISDEIPGEAERWITHDRNIAEVDENGVLKAKKAGLVKVTCYTSDNQSLSTEVNVVGFTDDDIYVKNGDTLDTILKSGADYESTGITWKVLDEKIASIDEAGKLSALSPGNTRVSAVLDGQTIQGELHVMDLPKETFTAVGVTAQLNLKYLEGEATWTTSDESIVTVADGILIGKKQGTAKVTATAHEQTFECDVTVGEITNYAAAYKSYDPSKLTFSKDLGKMVWSSEDDSIAYVDNGGNLTPVSTGQTNLLCLTEDVILTIPITVDTAELDEQRKAQEEAELAAAAAAAEAEQIREAEEAAKQANAKAAADNSIPISTEAITPAAKAIIASGDYYNNVLLKACKAGEKWVYSNSNKYVKQYGTFEDMLAGNIRGGNCASIANWALHDIGILKGSQKIYGDGKGKIHNYNAGGKSCKSTLDKYCNVINVESEKKSFGTLLNEGRIQVGDIILGVGHTYVYRGNGTVYASGHDAKWHKDKSVKTDDKNKAVFENWIKKYKGTYDERFKVHFIVHVKDDYIPTNIRDASGKLVPYR